MLEDFKITAKFEKIVTYLKCLNEFYNPSFTVYISNIGKTLSITAKNIQCIIPKLSINIAFMTMLLCDPCFFSSNARSELSIRSVSTTPCVCRLDWNNVWNFIQLRDKPNYPTIQTHVSDYTLSNATVGSILNVHGAVN